MRLLHLKTLTPEANKLLSGVGDFQTWQNIKTEIENGTAHLFLCDQNSYVVLQVCNDELVILACVGKNGIGIMQYLVEIARAIHLKFVWYRTQRQGMQRLLKRFNPAPYEHGYRIQVT